MNNPAKVIKGISIAFLVFGILGVILGLICAVGGGAVASMIVGNGDIADQINSAATENAEFSDAMDQLNSISDVELSASDVATGAGAIAAVMGVIIIIGSIWYFVCAGFGFKSAKSGSAGAAFVLGIISVVINLITLFSGGIIFIVNILLYGFYTYAAYKIKKDGIEVY